LRIQKYLRMCGVASRRKAEELVLKGHVSVNGLIVKDYVDVKVGDLVYVDGKEVQLQTHVYYMLNKPAGYITTKYDPQGRTTVFDLLKIEDEIFPVGRLDKDTEGLLILTNDGEMAQKLLHPRYESVRIYEAVVRGQIGTDEIDRLKKGLKMSYGYEAKMQISVISKIGDMMKIKVEIKEGKKREIRRALNFIGHPVISLRRISFGPIQLDKNLQSGQFRKLENCEVKKLLEYVNTRNETQNGSHRKTVEGG